ncbi:MAG: hypothetical protein A3C22_01595 [Candidatus Levybacteria bacterium RIFCSPHIGHO2_02_FULL_37_10]|uniref:Uncharacterized protein n=1 Tax=Candidatus Portnoybacteria bacterium RIFCSPHIGHO2_01_FULL_40_12b TaxID=1801994 RepID=A0A1G2FDF5_9BACT|nr:MAG: hypothetical protein A3C22_01595 [Candidatus Levybacteria bacterium RIFCSPHIGHO2_02_FULL_37_10]OGZ35690.1 MAG: hypothetical protein A2815_02970 [Candidatus Portnoybacteria bacterium RIFCSPHIGHO2_01_FULL_40_12b]
MNTNINLLLPKDDESLKIKKKTRIFNIIAIIFVFAIGTMSLVIFLLIQAADSPSLKEEQIDVLRKLSQFQDRQIKLLTANNRIENIYEILKTRKKLPQAANVLLERIPDNLSIGNLEIDSKAISMTAQSASLFSIGELINNLTDMVKKKEIINSLTLNSLIFNEDKNTYAVTIQADLAL